MVNELLFKAVPRFWLFTQEESDGDVKNIRRWLWMLWEAHGGDVVDFLCLGPLALAALMIFGAVVCTPSIVMAIIELTITHPLGWLTSFLYALIVWCTMGSFWAIFFFFSRFSPCPIRATALSAFFWGPLAWVRWLILSDA
jgi:hypothetical protein